MLKAVVATENSVNEYRTKNVGRWIFSSDKWKLHSLVRQDKPQNKFMSNPAIVVPPQAGPLAGWLRQWSLKHKICGFKPNYTLTSSPWAKFLPDTYSSVLMKSWQFT